MKNNKRKGYVLALVLVIGLVMAATAASTITIIFRYMIHAKENIPNSMEYQIEEVYTDARI
jgi:hypothetical protein